MSGNWPNSHMFLGSPQGQNVPVYFPQAVRLNAGLEVFTVLERLITQRRT
jgi:hypothetical protein